jgi:hypothetical protein
MNKFAVAARNVLLCALVTIPLAACGGSNGSTAATSTTANTDPATAQVQTNVGMINRSPTDGSANVASVASNTTSTATAPITTAASAPSSGSSSSTGSTTAAGTVAKVTVPVTPVSTTDGVATLDWLPPTANTDGTTLTNLAGYTVYYGTSPDNLSKSVKVSNAGVASYTVTGLASGTWYFAVTSYSADGVESARTSMVTTQI